MNKTSDSGQLTMHFCHDDASLQRYLEACLGPAVSLVLTDNSTSMLSARVKGGVTHVRLHRMFLNAGEPVLAEIVSFLKCRKGAKSCFRDFVRRNRERLREKPPKKISVKTIGRHHDLRELFDEINAEYFESAIDALITWGVRSSRYAVRKRTLGSYNGSSNIIRINPVLDKKSVPRYFVAFVVYHEMLHKVVGKSRQGSRRCVHSQEFKKMERLFKQYERAKAWETKSFV